MYDIMIFHEEEEEQVKRTTVNTFQDLKTLISNLDSKYTLLGVEMIEFEQDNPEKFYKSLDNDIVTGNEQEG